MLALSQLRASRQAASQMTRLANGVRVVTQKTSSPGASVACHLTAGTRFETPQNHGAARLADAIALAGTKTRTAAQIETEIGNLGGQLSKNVDREVSSLKLDVASGDSKAAIALLGDVVCNNAVSADAVEAQRAALLKEMAEGETSTKDIVMDRLHMTVWQDHPLGLSVLGPVDNVANLTRQDVAKYIKDNHAADRLVVSATGDVDHAAVVKQAEEVFKGLGDGAPRALEAESPYFCGASLRYYNNDLGPNAFVALAYNGVPHKHPDSIPYKLMAQMIGEWQQDSSRNILSSRLSGNRSAAAIAGRAGGAGCADYFHGFNKQYSDAGILGFYFQCDEKGVGRTVSELMLSINSFSFSVSDEDVTRAARELKVQLGNEVSSTSSLADKFGKDTLAYGRVMPADELATRLDSTTAKDIKRVAYENLHQAEIAVSAIGRLHGLYDLHALRTTKTTMYRYG